MKGLEDYFSVLEGTQPPKYRKTGKTLVDYDKDAPIPELWNIHDEAMQTIGEDRSGGEDASLLDLKADLARRLLKECCFCEHQCGVDRLNHELGSCRAEAIARYSSEYVHRGEEPELVPSHTIFFTGCTFECEYCQNWRMANSPRVGNPVLPEKLAETIAVRSGLGARNVNYVGGDPGPHLHMVLGTIARVRVDVPMIWNSNMYQTREAMRLLDGAIDVYLADFRYGANECANRLSNVDHYWDTITRNIGEADRQAEVLIRHLVLPGHLECCTQPIAEWIGRHMPNVRFNLIFQYSPQYKADTHPDINRPLTQEEQDRAVKIVEDAGLANVLV